MMDPTILGQLVDAHAAALELYARQWCAAPNGALPEDVVQDAFLKLVKQPVPPRNVVPWLFRVVRNGAISAMRAATARHKHEARAAARHASSLFTNDATTLDGADATRVLKSLPNEEREVITLHLWGGLTFAEVAEVIGSSSSTVHRWYIAGLEHMRERLDVPCRGSLRKT